MCVCVCVEEEGKGAILGTWWKGEEGCGGGEGEGEGRRGQNHVTFPVMSHLCLHGEAACLGPCLFVSLRTKRMRKANNQTICIYHITLHSYLPSKIHK